MDRTQEKGTNSKAVKFYKDLTNMKQDEVELLARISTKKNSCPWRGTLDG